MKRVAVRSLCGLIFCALALEAEANPALAARAASALSQGGVGATVGATTKAAQVAGAARLLGSATAGATAYSPSSAEGLVSQHRSSITSATIQGLCNRHEASTFDVKMYLASILKKARISSDDKMDLLQDTILRLIEACDRGALDVRGILNAPAYVRTVLKNVAADKGRLIPPVALLSLSDDESASAAAASIATSRSFDPYILLAARDELEKSILAMAHLSERQKQAVELAAEGRSRREIAQSLGVSEERVKELLCDARCRLRTALEKEKSARHRKVTESRP